MIYLYHIMTMVPNNLWHSVGLSNPHFLSIVPTLIMVMILYPLNIPPVSANVPSGESNPAIAQSIQGYVFWDQNGNGVLDQWPNELNNGVVDVLVEVQPCVVGDGGADEGEKNSVVIANAMTLWPPNRPDNQKMEGHSAIYPYGGYYKLDVGSNKGTNCLLTNDQLSTLKQQNNASTGTSDSTMISEGCYLTIIAPTDYEITSSFPIASADTVDKNGMVELESTAKDHWIPHNDNQHGIHFANNNDNNDAIENRGYRARTSRCFGYATSEHTWYSWEGSSKNIYSNKLRKISLPNDAQYGYDAYLNQQDSYDRTLSMTPAGMIPSLWPLPLRVSSTEPDQHPLRPKWIQTTHEDYTLFDEADLEGHRYRLAQLSCFKQGLVLCDYDTYCPSGLGNEVFQGGWPLVFNSSDLEETQWAPYQHSNGAWQKDPAWGKWVQIGKMSIADGGTEGNSFAECYKFDDWYPGSNENIEDVWGEEHMMWFLCCETEPVGATQPSPTSFGDSVPGFPEEALSSMPSISPTSPTLAPTVDPIGYPIATAPPTLAMSPTVNPTGFTLAPTVDSTGSPITASPASPSTPTSSPTTDTVGEPSTDPQPTPTGSPSARDPVGITTPPILGGPEEYVDSSAQNSMHWGIARTAMPFVVVTIVWSLC